MKKINKKVILYSVAIAAAVTFSACSKQEQPIPPTVEAAKPAVSQSEPPQKEEAKASLTPAAEKPELNIEQPKAAPAQSEKTAEQTVPEVLKTEKTEPEKREEAEPALPITELSTEAAQPVEQAAPPAEAAAPAATTRATKQTIRLPSAPGKQTKSSSSAEVDYSNCSQGYIMVKYKGSNPKVKLQITGPNNLTYTYSLHKGGYTAFPLTGGSGSYSVNVFENVSGTSYAAVLSCSFGAQLSSSLLPYLYPNQYVNYNAASKAVAKGEELAATAATKLELVEKVYNYIISHVTYDDYKAATVKSGYTPKVDDTLSTGKGICFDYAALMACMLRTQDILVRMEVGYVNNSIYHAWISVYIDDIGWINGIIKFDGTTWSMMDPTFASSSTSPKSYTTDSYSYSVKYLY